MNGIQIATVVISLASITLSMFTFRNIIRTRRTWQKIAELNAETARIWEETARLVGEHSNQATEETK